MGGLTLGLGQIQPVPKVRELSSIVVAVLQWSGTGCPALGDGSQEPEEMQIN